MDLFEAIGGVPGCVRLATAFYSRVSSDPVLRPLFPGKSHRCAIEAFASFLVQFFDGPAEDARHRWWLSLRESHRRFQIGPEQRVAWLKTMVMTLDEVPIDSSAREALKDLFGHSSQYVVNSPESVPLGTRWDGDARETAQRWNRLIALDEAIACVRSGESRRAVELAEGPALRPGFERNRSLFAAFLAQLIASGHPELLEYAQEALSHEPALAKQTYSGRTLLHAAAAAGNALLAGAMIASGANPDTETNGGHTPLYCLGNECLSGGTAVVEVLVKAGANVNACEGVKRCTPLHMAARRGNIELSKALLDCGANIEARDSLGDTPLRRAVNCGRTGVVALLLKHGADPHSIGSKRLTPTTAARTSAMWAVMGCI